jgi:hypothetical protein
MRVFTIVLIVLIRSFHVHAQNKTVLPVQDEDQPETAYPISLYKSATVYSQNLFNGRRYYIYDAKMEEHQFFEGRKWQNGTVYYDGQRFDSIPMLYDIVKDELVIRHFNSDPLILQFDKVDYFIKNNHIFRRLEAGKDIDPQMRTGYYDLLYEGKSKVVARRSKQRQEKIVDKRVIGIFPEKSFYYIIKNDRYHYVRSRKSVLALFPEKKKELRKMLRNENINFRKERETAIARMSATYDALGQP